MSTSPAFRAVEPLRKRLRQRYRELREIIRDELIEADAERYSDLAELVHDLGDESVADLLADVNLAVIDHHIAEVRDIEAALARIGGGTYGECSDCGEAIDAARLEAYPTAKRCHRCQSRREQSHVQPGRPRL
ncbi:MAG: TraR/DksA C4-type zinc finger protein [Gammaproteobacteria bacterium]|nr:TraR/DksA C4-type zinc finger protein [Gammaproteobacteria bacterium]